MSEYKVARVSSEPPREYNGKKGTIYYIKVMLEGYDKPVSIGKRKPDALNVGDSVYGTILPTKYEADNFKAESKPNQAFGGQGKDQGLITAQWAIGQGMSLEVASYSKTGSFNWDNLERSATQLFAMAYRIKETSTEQKAAVPAWEKAREKFSKQEAPTGANDTFSDGSPLPDFDEEPINLDDIPF